MYLHTLAPRFCETDALGHINNTVLPVWFEQAREPICRLFTPGLDTESWRLIIARIEVDYTAELKYGADVEIRTCLEKVGNSSMHIHHEAWQNNVLAARGKAVVIHYDFAAGKATSIPEDIRQALLEHVQ
ncbi:acyl-CoA thioesterase [Endozoicomonas sp. ALC020]|uniref:acyl-CoA thioesterase n=1 Tax=unclassified Endozoicomonas TaxID=2644528 RepID=UPI003BB0ABD2